MKPVGSGKGVSLSSPRDLVLGRGGVGMLAVRLCFAVALVALCGVETVADDEPAMTREEARSLTSPVAYTDEAVREGRKHYLRLCQNCHGKDGRALESFDFEATDLTRPEDYRHGSTDGDLYFSTKHGAGNDMPPFAEKLSDEQVWEVVWFLRSIGPESARPQADVAPAVESEAP
jgi:mono/diheme cytochrome c family protein